MTGDQSGTILVDSVAGEIAGFPHTEVIGPTFACTLEKVSVAVMHHRKSLPASRLKRSSSLKASQRAVGCSLAPAGKSEQELRYFVQGTTLESARTENPADSAAFANRWSPQMKLLLDGRCWHQIKDAASCRLSAARKECLSNNCVAKSRT